jgi:hypothetical protein
MVTMQTMTDPCTCADYTDADECDCTACPDQAMGIAGCPHRLNRTLDGPASNYRTYDGMCDLCFADARAVRDCGLRVAEH